MAVTGILIIIALMLALQIDRVKERPDRSQISSDSDPIGSNPEELKELEITLLEMKEHLEVIQSASRKTESESEIKAEIARLEDKISGVSARPLPANQTVLDLTSIDSIKSQAVEIIRLREEIKECKEVIAHSADSAVQARQTMLELERKVREVESLVAVARLQRKKLNLIRKLSDTTKEPIIVDVAENRLRIMRFDNPQPVDLSSLQDFYGQIKTFKKQDQYFVLYFRPSGASRFEELRQAVKNSGFELGYDAIEEDAELSLGKAGGS